MIAPKNIIISRTDSIGDTILTLPIAAVLKKNFPDICIGFMGTPYTKPIVEACSNIDVFIDKEEFMTQPITLAGEKPQCIMHVFPRPELAKRAKELKIPIRIGTTNRLYHWPTCNKLVKLSRRCSNLHEAQLNLKLLKPLGIQHNFSLCEIESLFALNNLIPLPEPFISWLNPDKFKLIIHPKSRGSGREWDLNHYISLIEMLDLEKFQIFVSGTPTEKEALQPLFDKVGHRVTNVVGVMSLPEFLAFINVCDGLLASSTGPVHVAAALQKHALGLYPPLQPIHPGRWQPVGAQAKYFVLDKECSECRPTRNMCACIQAIQPVEIKNALEAILLAGVPVA